MIHPYAVLAIAAASNVSTIYFLKASAGMSRLWPTIGVVVSILLTQWLVARVMASGMDVAGAITGVVVAVMLASGIVGLMFGERIGLWQGVGYGLAVTGVVIANLAARPAG